MSTKNSKGRKKHRLRRLVILGIGGAAVYTYVQVTRKPKFPCACALDERVKLKDEDNIGGVGLVMENMIGKYLEDPAKVSILDRIELVIAIQPLEEPESAITMTFSGGCVVIEPGMVAAPDITLVCDYDVLMALPQMGVGLQTVKYMMTPEGQDILRKFMSGQIKVRGKILHFPEMIKLSMLLAVPEEDQEA